MNDVSSKAAELDVSRITAAAGWAQSAGLLQLALIA